MVIVTMIIILFIIIMNKIAQVNLRYMLVVKCITKIICRNHRGAAPIARQVVIKCFCKITIIIIIIKPLIFFLYFALII